MVTVFNNSKWISAPKEVSSPIFYKEFEINCDHIKKAVLSITGLGYFEAMINGKPVTDYRLLPVASDYEKRDLSRKALYYPIEGYTGKNRIYFYRFNVKKLLNNGKNTLTVQLGNGWYIAKDFGEIKKTVFSLCITSDDGKTFVNSDGLENWTDSQIKYNNIFTGEIHDVNILPRKRHPVFVEKKPNAVLSRAIGIPDKIIRSVPFVYLGEADGRKIFDLNQSISGIVKVKTSAKKDSRITLRFAELLTESGELAFNFGIGAEWQVDGAPQIMKDTFITDGKKREFTPKFVWHAFRYFDVEGDFDELEVLELRTDTRVTSEFSSDSEGLNFLYNAFLSTQLGNMHGSFPSDCPHRERIGYTGDGQLCSLATMMTTDSREFYKKWIIDILDCQMKDGYVHHSAPYYGGAGGPGIWGSAIVYVPYNYYLTFGDESMLRLTYNGMKKWINYLSECLENGLLTHEVPSSLALGDWANLGGVQIPSEYVNSCCFIKILAIISRIAKIIGKSEDIPYYSELKEKISAAVTENFLGSDKITFADGIQGADAFAVWCGIAGKTTADHLAQSYKDADHFDTGIMGTDILLEVLFEYGYTDIAYNLLESREKGTFLYMKDNGATTLWENWGGGRMSRFHPMFGGVVRHFFSSILGIKQVNGSAGYKKIRISPKAPEKMNFAKGKMMTPLGEIKVSWQRINGKVQVSYSIPDGVEVIN